MMRLTIWHKGTDKPVRDGVYQRVYDEGTQDEKIFYCRFAESMWFAGSEHYFIAATETSVSPFQEELKWRGITKDGK